MPHTLKDHRLGIAGMVACTVLWSIAGVVTRWTTVGNGFEVTFWRSAACVVCVALWLVLRNGTQALERVSASGWPGLASGCLWAVMFTCFMVALTRTTVANTLVVSSLQPFFAAIAARVFLAEQVPGRTWLAMAAAFGGIVVMFADALGGGTPDGVLIALGVPLAAAANVVLLKRYGGRVDFVPAVLIGALLSSLATLPLASPLAADARDAAILGFLGAVQLALPCVFLAAWVVKRLSAAEVALLALLEVLLGPLWVWAVFAERPSNGALLGGAIVLAALIANEAVGLWRERQAARAGALTS